MKTVIEAKAIGKRYDQRLVVDGLSFTVQRGEIFGLLGPSGSGKTTAMKMLYGSTSITEGEIYVLDLNAKKNFREIKERIGIVPQHDALDADLSVFENLVQFARYQLIDSQISQRRAQELLRLMHLEEDHDHAIAQLSPTMKKRLSLARGMINNPELLFLDEPTFALVPEVRQEMRTVVLSTSNLQEAERLCNNVVILDQGKILVAGQPRDLLQQHIGIKVIELRIPRTDIGYYGKRLQEKNYKYLIMDESLNVHLQEQQDQQEVLKLVHSEQISIRQPNLNDVFLKLSGHKPYEELA